MMYFSYIGRAKGQWKYMVYAVIAYTIVFGIRYGVGKDYINYLQNFEAYATSETHWGMSQSFELGFHFLTQTIAAINLHPTIYFSVIAFMQLFLTLLPFKKETELYPYIIFTFMVGCTWLSYANIVRQTIALSIGIFAIKFIVEKKVWHFYITAFIALTMHLSAVLLFLFYPLFNYRKEWFRNIKFQLLLLVIGLFLMKINIIMSLAQNFESLILITGYEEYLSDDQAQNLDRDVDFGFGFVVMLCINTLLILFSNKVKDYFQSKYLNIVYNLFAIGVPLKYILVSSITFSRLNCFFINMTFIVAAYTLRYAHKNNRLLFFALCALYVLTLAAIIFKAEGNTALYIFYWQDDLYYLKS